MSGRVSPGRLVSHPSVDRGRRASSAGSILLCLRPRQWSKNLLVFVGVVFAQRLNDPAALGTALIAFGVFCLLSSSGYVVNDIVDAEADRHHPTKSERPIARGLIPVGSAWVLAAGLLGAGLLMGALLQPVFLLVAVLYLGTSLAYTFWLKHFVLVDVFAIAAGFVFRAVAGAAVIDVPVSTWLYVCTVFGALVIALGKRRSELVVLEDRAGGHRRNLGSYSMETLDQFITIVASGAIMAYSFYTFSAENLPANHAMMLTIPIVLYGVFRYLYLIQKSTLGGSPEELLLRDRPLAAAVMSWAVASLLVLYGLARLGG